MTTVARTTALTAPPDAVFAAVNDPATAPLIDPAVRVWRPDTDPIGVGTRFTIRGQLGVVPIRGTSEVIEWQVPDRSVFRSVSPTWPATIIARHEFPVGADGGTDYTWTMSITEVSVLGRPAIALAARLFARAMAEQAEALTAYLTRA